MARRRKILSATLSLLARNALDRRTGSEGRSAALSGLIERYDTLLDRVRPELLSRSEWMAICDALNGCWLRGPDWMSIHGIGLQIHDSDRLDGLGRKWKIDAQALSRRLHEMSDAEQLAVVDTVERFWAAHSRGEQAEVALPPETEQINSGA